MASSETLQRLPDNFGALVASTLTADEASMFAQHLQLPTDATRAETYAAIATALSVSINHHAAGQSSAHLARTLHLLATAEAEAGQLADAATRYEKVIAIHESNHTYPGGCLASMSQLGPVLISLRRVDEAERLLRPLQVVLEDALGALDPQTLACMRNLAEALYRTGAKDDAYALIETLETRVESLAALRHIEEAAALVKLRRRLQL